MRLGVGKAEALRLRRGHQASEEVTVPSSGGTAKVAQGTAAEDGRHIDVACCTLHVLLPNAFYNGPRVYVQPRIMHY